MWESQQRSSGRETDTYFPKPGMEKKIEAKYKLTYFDLGAKAEAIRMLLRHANVPFEDNRVSFPAFQTLKKSGKLPNGQLPILEASDMILYQKTAILRFLGRTLDYYPSDAMSGYVCDVAMEVVEEIFIREKFHGYFLSPAPIDAPMASALVAKASNVLRQLEAILGGERKFFGGNNLCIADFHVTAWSYMCVLNTTPAQQQPVLQASLAAELDRYPYMRRYLLETMLTEVGEYLTSRPVRPL